MSTNYDNWKRLLRAVRFRELDKQMILLKSTKSPLSSFDLGYNTTSAIIDDNNISSNEKSISHPQIRGGARPQSMEGNAPHRQRCTSLEIKLFIEFFMDKNGKNCFLFGAYSRPVISPKDGLKFTYDLKSRFGRVAKLKNKWGVDISCSISAQFLSPETTYVVYIVIEYNYKNESRSPQKALSFVGFNESKWEYGYSKERARIVDFGRIKERSDRWDEVEIGRFYVGLEEENSFREERDVLVQLLGSSGYIIEGIEFRPLEEES